MIREIRFDRGTVLAKRKGNILEGIAGRVHREGDGLEYTTGAEYRDAAEVKSIASQLASGRILFTVDHPRTMPASADKSARVAGMVIGGRLDGDHAVATIRIDDPKVAQMIVGGQRELSLGYSCDIDANHYQRNIRVDHLALVAAARCGSTCSLRSDSKGKAMCDCKDNVDQDLELAAKTRMKARLANAKTDGEPSRFANVSSTGATFADEIRQLTGAFDVPAEAIAQAAMAARTANQFVIDETERAALVKQHVINSIKKLVENA